MKTIDCDNVDWKDEIKKYDRYHHRLRNVAKHILSLQGIESVLDIGCAGGKLGNLLPPGIDYYGCDIVQDKLPELDGGKYVVWNAENDELSGLGFRKNNFDCVVASGLIEHVVDQRAVLNKITSLLSDGGYLVLTYASPEFLFYRLGLMIRENDRAWIKRLLPFGVIRECLSELDMQEVSIHHLSYFVQYKKRWPLTSALNPLTNQYVFIFKK